MTNSVDVYNNSYILIMKYFKFVVTEFDSEHTN